MERSPVRPAGALMSVVVGGGGGAATWSGRPSVLADALMSVMVVVVWLVVGAATWSGRPSVRLVPSCRWWSVVVVVQPRGAVARPSWLMPSCR